MATISVLMILTLTGVVFTPISHNCTICETMTVQQFVKIMTVHVKIETNLWQS